MITIVTLSDESMSTARELCAQSAIARGADRRAVWDWESFKALRCYEDNKALFDQPRGLGYWAWKPEIIGAAMRHRSEGDVVIYSDAGVEFIEPASIVIDRMEQDIWLFGNETLHRHWCKRDIIEAIWPERSANYAGFGGEMGAHKWLWDSFDKQCQASVIFFRVNDYTRAFVKEWLDWCLFEDGRLIDDSPSRLPNHPEFKENRHDQAILTTLAYREGIKLHHWFVKYPQNTPGRGPFYPNDNYPPLYMHHRYRNSQWEKAK